MARIRTIKPEFWVDEKIGECSTNARLLFIASWSFADDKGSLERSAKQLKAQAFPYDTIDCEPLVQELLDAGLLIEYSAGDGKIYLHVNHFSEHQRIDKPGKPRVPLYAESKSAQVGLQDDSTNAPGVLHAGLGVIREKDKDLRHPVDNGDNGDNSAGQRGDVRQKVLAAAALYGTAAQEKTLRRLKAELPARLKAATHG